MEGFFSFIILCAFGLLKGQKLSQSKYTDSRNDRKLQVSEA